MKIRTKILGGYLFIILMMTVIGMTGYYGANQAKQGSTLLYDHYLVHIVNTAKFQQEFSKALLILHEYIQDHKQEHLQELNTSMQKITQYEKILMVMDNEQIIDRIKTDSHSFTEACTKTKKSIQNNNQEEAENVFHQSSHAFMELNLSLTQLIQHYQTNAEATKNINNTTAQHAITILFVIAGVVILFSIIFGFSLTSSITKPLNTIIKGLHQGSEQIVVAAAQVSSAGSSLAQGSSEQASGIEETSASLEDMSSTTIKNADKANQANEFMEKVREVVNKANTSINELTASMQEINKASEETSKIIKTIDEIAFQTNLLALNAAVEAARAGEAGAGFAVVAEEVRNLAMRVAEAAKNTSELIEGTVKKIEQGSNLVTTSNKAFTEVAEIADKIGKLISEIATASNQQSQGIKEINKGMADMDKITQQNASTAEETSSSAEEMTSQSRIILELVNQLIQLTGGLEEHECQAVPTEFKPKKVSEKPHSTLTEFIGDTEDLKKAPSFSPRLSLKKPQDIDRSSPKDIIPFDEDDEDDFEDF